MARLTTTTIVNGNELHKPMVSAYRHGQKQVIGKGVLEHCGAIPYTPAG